MGILNVTPDSFSDGGRWMDPRSAVDHGLRMVDEGALIVDVGGESTRPGARRVDVDEEWERIGLVVAGLARRNVLVSVDTVHAETARRAIDAGAGLVNDVSGGVVDPNIVGVAAAADVAMVIQHWRGFPSDPSLDHDYDDVVTQVRLELSAQVRSARRLGLPERSVIVDPGLGFAKGADDSWTLVEHIGELTAEMYPVLVGASRKRFVAARFGADIEEGTLATTRMAVASGAWAVRVHDVARNVRLIDELTDVGTAAGLAGGEA